MSTENLLFLGLFLNLSVVLMVVLGHINVSLKTLSYATIFMIFFPIPVRLMGRDALTTGTVCILVLYLSFLVKAFRERKIIRDGDLCVYAVLFCGVVSTMIAIYTGQYDSEQTKAAIRQCFIFGSALLFYIVVKNTDEQVKKEAASDNLPYVDRLLNLFLLLTAVHILIALAIKYFPVSKNIFLIFYTLDSQSIATGQDLARSDSFVYSYEDLGEIVASLAPIVIYKWYKHRHYLWLLCLSLYAYGALTTVTRSAIVLFLLGSVISWLYYSRLDFRNTLVMAGVFLISLVVVSAAVPTMLEEVLERFDLATEAYESGGTLFETINRGNLPDIWESIDQESPMLGHGLYRVDFHNLFLTTMYQIGFVGVALFFSIFIGLVVRLARVEKNDDNRALIFSCLMFIAIFMINETKFEFTRTASYMQICCGLFGTMFLASKACRKDKLVKPH